ncbi:MAG: CHASE domain-containing protein, partial [Gammaproteobacteria bacterium]|nr:CHASE domain-containing protein [Gammaproteobacteria bacterium]
MVIRSETWRHRLRGAAYLFLLAILVTVVVHVLRGFFGAAEAHAGHLPSIVGLALAAIGLLAHLRGHPRLAFPIGVLVCILGSLGLLSLLLAYGGFATPVTRLGMFVLERVSISLNIVGPLAFLGLVIAGLARYRDRQSFLDMALAVTGVSSLALLAEWLGNIGFQSLDVGSLQHGASEIEVLVMLLFNVGLALKVLSADDADFRRRGMFLPHFAFLLVLASSFNLWMFLVEKEQAIVYDQTLDHASRVEAVLLERQSDRLMALMRMARRYESSGGTITREQWQSDARRYLAAYHELVALGVVTPDKVIRWGITRSNPDFGVGRSYGSDPERARILRETRESNEPLLSPPLDLFPDQAGQIAVLPLYDGDDFLGWLIGSIGFDNLLNRIVDDVAREYAI